MQAYDCNRMAARMHLFCTASNEDVRPHIAIHKAAIRYPYSSPSAGENLHHPCEEQMRFALLATTGGCSSLQDAPANLVEFDGLE